MKQDKPKSRLHKTISFIKLLRVEPYMFLSILSFMLIMTPLSQLKQDKICRLKYNRTVDECINLAKLNPTTEDGSIDFKSAILSESAQLSNYYTMISTLPTFLWVLILGPWIDKYVKGRKIIVIASNLGTIISMALELYMSINFETSN